MSLSQSNKGGETMNLKITKGYYNISGVTYINKGFNFCFSLKNTGKKKKNADRKKEEKNQPCCSILLINIDNPKVMEEVEVPAGFIIGEMCAVHIAGIDYNKYGYAFKINDEIVMDPYAKRVFGRKEWAGEDSEFLFAGFKMANDSGSPCLHLRKQDIVMYHLNVRTYTKASGTKDAGTFAALKRKLSYIKDIGVTALQLMPVYDFDEKASDKINVWGYSNGFYFAPKASYSYSKDVTGEFAALVDACHENGIMVILDFYADRNVNQVFTVEAMKYYVSEYGIDGFTLMGDGINTDIVLGDPLLKKTYFFKDYFSDEQIYNDDNQRLFIQNDDFLYAMRKLISTKSGNMNEAYSQIRKQSKNNGYVNYMTSHNGFTLYDLFSYATKHNEDNLEANRDGSDYNLSINCGIEGPTKKKDILNKRTKCMYNSLAMMFLSQGVPMLLAGDERCNSQNGNNNAYCQDNEIGWVSWKNSNMSQAIQDYIKNLISFRREHKMISRPVPHDYKDTMNAGLPDASLHGREAWIGSLGWDANLAGICYCGKFAGENDDVYLAFNFSASDENMALPVSSGKAGWQKVMDTSKNDPFKDVEDELYVGTATISAMSVVILKTIDVTVKKR